MDAQREILQEKRQEVGQAKLFLQGAGSNVKGQMASSSTVTIH